ncbi:3-deoxy-manno-octulosonate cytidylyltransferase [Halomonas sp. DP5N14-9]|uniref:3-deoxy-manno-octulosonate cytidylyltransferase n=1 Tax=unclassified Halomonas TaxID=2609666 RepID=UPI001BCFCC7A|nr:MULTISPECIES: 3-deoxy-manno-octulosonate cytidylyltransferase [unclassified Halomonas]MBS8268923.1 3-deoxy-manno-octulosonate cytidylyltransferase [Halomonas litopenaei]MBY5941984.1 3-deoxy-manno-octulosonate cytidylyltransferase [Halomonas sp. DP5N14-9]MBY6112203.1 3-deoxy-manno-octulosonate cytidylyltransferase [Halomonas sp. DP1Y21-3]|tara:strand:+ start:314 stop:1093 length:780 start_codon:yes stop_codon:yes gene_type:complete
MQDFIVVIPARYGSSRLPGKPLADIAGRPMVARVWDQARRSSASRVVIATDDARIESVMLELGAEVVMTREDHTTGTDRLAEVVERLALPDEAVLVNVQGDEPLLPPELIDQVAGRLMRDEGASVATLAESIGDVDTLFNPNVVKVTRAASGRALSFSRAPMPWDREGFREPPALLTTDAWLRHIGLYAYRASFLRAFSQWLPAPIEQLEQLEQLRALHYGHAIQVALAEQTPGAGVDTAEDLERVRAHFAGQQTSPDQ